MRASTAMAGLTLLAVRVVGGFEDSGSSGGTSLWAESTTMSSTSSATMSGPTLDEVRVARRAHSLVWAAAQPESMVDNLLTFGPPSEVLR